MALVLLLVFRSRLRLLPLAVALAAAALTFGLFGLVGGSLTMASIAALPILIGLAVDYAIQFQARFDEAVAAGSGGVEAARAAAAAGGPTIATACLATGAGFLALLLSPTPMVRSFGLLLVVGIAIAFGLALTAGFAALSLRSPKGGGRAPSPRRRAPRSHLRGLERLLALAVEPARASCSASGSPWPSSAGDWAPRSKRVSDVRELAPQSIREVRDLNRLQEATGVSGELDVRVEAPDLTDPGDAAVDGGLQAPRARARTASPGPTRAAWRRKSARGRRSRTSSSAAARCVAPTSARRSPNCPPTTSQQVAPADPRTGLPGHTALISFGIRAQSLDDQQALIDRVRGEIGEPGAPGGPPAGVEVELAGLPVIAAAAASDLSGSRYWLALAGLLAVALVLLRRLPLAPARPGPAGAGRPRQRLVVARALGQRASRSTRCRRRSGR